MEGAFFLFVLLTVLGSLVNGYVVSLNKKSRLWKQRNMRTRCEGDLFS